MKLKATPLLLLLPALMVLLTGCRGGQPPTPIHTIDVEATVEARLNEERAVEATIEARVEKRLSAIPTPPPRIIERIIEVLVPSIPIPTPTPLPTPTVSIVIKEIIVEKVIEVVVTATPTPVPPTSTPITIFSPTPTPTPDIETYSLSVNSVPVTTAEIQFPEGRILVSPPPNVNNQYAYGTIVTLTGIADSGYVFIGWIGSCLGGSLGSAIQCVVIMNGDRLVQTNFPNFQVAPPEEAPTPTPTATATPA